MACHKFDKSHYKAMTTRILQLSFSDFEKFTHNPSHDISSKDLNQPYNTHTHMKEEWWSYYYSSASLVQNFQYVLVVISEWNDKESLYSLTVDCKFVTYVPSIPAKERGFLDLYNAVPFCCWFSCFCVTSYSIFPILSINPKFGEISWSNWLLWEKWALKNFCFEFG